MRPTNGSQQGSARDIREHYSIRQLVWDDTNHLRVLTQLQGSVWPKTIPFCLSNVVLTLLVFYLKKHGIDLQTSSTLGHRFMAMVMSFLVVTRVKITYDDFMSDSKALQELCKSTREIVGWLCHVTVTDKHAQQYRHDVALAALELLDLSARVLVFRSKIYTDRLTHVPRVLDVHRSKNPRFQRHSNLLRIDSLSLEDNVRATQLLTEACRAPNLAALKLRQTIMLQREENLVAPGTFLHPCNEEMRLLDMVANFLKNFDTLEVHMTTPLPFPFVQMTKTFLFVWVFSLPLVLPISKEAYLILSLILVCLITYGFVGLEFVAMELSDGFGDDPSDLDVVGHCEHCFEDCYLAIYKLDGVEWAKKLKSSFTEQSTLLGSGLDEDESQRILLDGLRQLAREV